MTPQKKAKELVKKYETQFLSFGDYLPPYKAKECALIASVECIKSFGEMGNIMALWWIQVNKEIKKL